MSLDKTVVFLGAFLFAGVVSALPDFGKFYTVSGTLRLPYAELNEPFSVIYDRDAAKSRISYYDDTVVTIQIGAKGKDYGRSYMIAPMTIDTPGKEKTNVQTCFLSNGTKAGPVNSQSILPDLTGFTSIGKGPCPTLNGVLRGGVCETWQNVSVRGAKKNTYTLWVLVGTGKHQIPLRYEMMGYDTLIGSHYDKYYVDYDPATFDNTVKPDPTKFDVPKNMTCGGFPGPGAETRILSNPMREFIHHDDSHVHELFDKFKVMHQKVYSNQTEHNQRKEVFRQNLRFIHSKNRAGLSYTLRVNHMADLTEPEMKRRRGYFHTPGYNGGMPFNKNEYEVQKLPAQVDWRLYGAVSQVKDQATCGSCWSFGTVGTIEGAYFLKTGSLVRFSQQELMDCSWGEGNNACDGGEDFRSYQWIMRNGGLATEESYGPYLGQDGKCHNKNANKVAKITGYVNVTSGDLDALKIAIALHGPISVAIDASHKSLSFYGNGVYYEPKCGNTPDDLDHAVLAVGYGVLRGQAYWLIKNSWSTYWGNDGYVLMAQKDNNCGVATDPTFVTM